MTVASDSEVCVPAGPVSLDALRHVVRRLRVEHERNLCSVNLVPSENCLSPLARLPLRLDFYNRYFFNDELAENFWHFRGGRGVGDVEVGMARPALGRLAHAQHVNVRPISGMSAMIVTMVGLGGPAGGVIISVDGRSGGHYATQSLIGKLGRTAVAVGVHRGKVDVDTLRQVLRTQPVSLVYLDLQNSLWQLDVAEVVSVVREHGQGTRVHVDCSHTMGLVLGGVHDNPLDFGADSMGGSTHKSFPGPHKGVLFTRDADVAHRLKEAQFYLISSHHFAETLSLGLAAAEFEHFGCDYARQVVVNARAFGAALRNHGFDLVPHGNGITDTHQLWLRCANSTETERFVEGLAAISIRVNPQPDLPGAPGLNIRLGLSEITFAGARENALRELAVAFAHVRDGKLDKARQAGVDARNSYGAPFHFADLAVGDEC